MHAPSSQPKLSRSKKQETRRIHLIIPCDMGLCDTDVTNRAFTNILGVSFRCLVKLLYEPASTSACPIITLNGQQRTKTGSTSLNTSKTRASRPNYEYSFAIGTHFCTTDCYISPEHQLAATSQSPYHIISNTIMTISSCASTRTACLLMQPMSTNLHSLNAIMHISLRLPR